MPATATPLSRPLLKAALKEALVEVLHEERDLFREVLAEALEELMLAEALREHDAKPGRPSFSDEVFAVLGGEA